MQPRVVQAGPLVAATATKIALAQTPVAAGALALNGAAGAAVANNICLSQSGTAATALLLNGALSQTRYVSPTSGKTGATIAVIPDVRSTAPYASAVYTASTGGAIYITSAGNDSAITFALVGMDFNNTTIKETITGTNAGVVASVNSYKSILSITPSGNTGSTVTVGSMGVATLDTARRVLFTSAGTDTAVTITISGTDWAGYPISETLLGGSSGVTVYTVLDYLTITQVKVSAATASTISVGTNGVASSQWIPLDTWANGTVSGQCVPSGTVNYSVQLTSDDPDSYANPIARASVSWDSTAAGSNVNNATTEQMWAGTPVGWARVTLNSNTNPGYVRMTLIQHSSVPI